MTTPEGLEDISISENHYCIRSFSRLKTCNNVFEKFNNGMQQVIKHVSSPKAVYARYC